MTLLRSCAVVAVVSLASCAAAQVTITPIVVPGQPAPGSVGVFNGPQPPATRSAGRVIFNAFLSGTPSPGFDSAGVWEGGPGAGGVVGDVIVQGSAPAGLGGRIASSVPGFVVQNRSGAAVFAQRLNAPFTNDATVLLWGTTGLQFAIREGDAAPGVPGALIGEVGLASTPDFALSDSGQLAILAPLTGVSSGFRAILAGDPMTQTYSMVARQGDPSPLPGAPAFSFLTPPSINGVGDVAFYSTLAAPPFASLFVRPSGGALQAVLSQGDAAPGFAPGSTVSLLFGASSGPAMLNNAREFVIVGNVAIGGGGSSTALWRGAPGAPGAPGALQLVAKAGDPAPGAPNGVNFAGGFTAQINGSGAAMFSAQLSSGVFPSGFWIAPRGQAPALLTFLNAQAPDMAPGVLLTSVSNGGFALNNRGEGMINASLNYVVNSTPANGIFAGTPGNLRKVVASGDQIEVAPGVVRTVVSVLCWSNEGPETGRLTSINDQGQIAFSCSFVGGGGGVFLAQLPNPCPGDATGDGVVNFADLNAVLSQFGAVGAGLSGDLNSDGVVNFADLNLVLSVFGLPCP